MIKKVSLIIIILFAIALPNITAQSDEDINKAFICLDARVGETSLSLEEAIFSALVKVPDEKVNSKINSEKSSSEECWPKSGCKVKDTSQVLIAKQAMGEDTTAIAQWIISKAATTKELTWYLQITTENNAPSECSVLYDDSEKKINVNDEMKIEGNPGSCLSITPSGYWLKISNNCVEKEYSISCDVGFKTNLLYEKSTGGTIFVSSQTHSAASKGITKEKITAKCFREGNKCNYESSLWATTALYSSLEETSEYVPYLRALAAENQKYFPDAFIRFIIGATNSEEEYGRIIQSRQLRGFWQAPGTPYNKFYDTSLAMIALGGADAPELTDITLPALFDEQGENGCWNSGNIRDTAFIIYSAGWQRAQPPDEGTFICGNGIIEQGETCDIGANAISTQDDILGGATCVSKGYNSGNISCSPGCLSFNVTACVGTPPGDGEAPPDIGTGEVCADINGECRASCETGEVSTDGVCDVEGDTCCVPEGSTDIYDPNTITDCELEGFFCSPDVLSCLESGGETLPQDIYSCSSYVQVCCTIEVPESDSCFERGGEICLADEVCPTPPLQASDGACCLSGCQFTESSDTDTDTTPTTPTEEGGSLLWLWITLLIILIILVVLGIIFRDKIRLWWFKFRGKAKTSKVQPGVPPSGIARRPPPSFAQRPMPQQMRRPMPQQIQRTAGKPMNEKDKEMEETLKKLREMSK
ncbi:hypothetical protein HY450_02745 [Candidatus Pacearchaeota archaeon]|nr:hypothetical protein [Candidatus Pacearchaeota archaeon]